MLKFIYAAMFALTAAAIPLFADVSMGEKLETQMWEDMKHQNYSAVEANIANEFQAIHTFGTLNRAGEIELIKNLSLGTYEISNVVVTEDNDTIVVSYLISVKEKIENKALSSTPAPRLSVWRKFGDKWKWIAHANLKEIPTKKAQTPVTPKAAH